MHQKSIELRLWQRIGPFLFNRVLCGHYHEERRQLMRGSSHGNLTLLHRFEQRGLNLRRSAVDLICQNEIVEHGSRLKAKLSLALRRVIDLRTGDVRGQQVGRELNSREARVKKGGELLDCASLSKPRQTFDQEIAVRQQANNKPLDHLFLSKNGLSYLLLELENNVERRQSDDRFHMAHLGELLS